VKESDELNAHSQRLSAFILELFQQTGLQPIQLSAVAVSQGPGSYTGLRIGMSTAKGLCYGLSIPLILIPTNLILAKACLHECAVASDELICSMIDARRMEVYHSIYDARLNAVIETEPHILTDKSYQDYLEKSIVHFVGDGVAKASTILSHPSARFHNDVLLSSRYMIQLALDKLQRNDVDDVAYSTPFYLKEFLTKPPKSYF